jgi:hypothetical protein
LEKSRQPLDLPKKQGGYGHVGSSSSRSREPLDRGSVTRQPSDLTGAARGLPSGFEGSVVPWSNVFRHLKPRNPGKIGIIHLWRRVVDIEASELRGLEAREIHREKPDEFRAVHLLGQVAGDREFIGISECQETRIRDQENPETTKGS